MTIGQFRLFVYCLYASLNNDCLILIVLLFSKRPLLMASSLLLLNIKMPFLFKYNNSVIF